MSVVPKDIVKNTVKNEKDIHSFNVFDISARCAFEKLSTVNVLDRLKTLDLSKNGKIISINTTTENSLSTFDLIDFYTKNEYKVLKVSCTEELAYRPWGFFETIFREYFEIPFHSSFIDLSNIDQNSLRRFKALFDLVLFRPIKAATAEDARFAYMELWNKFLSTINNTVILIEGFENLDDTSIQTLNLYFDKFKNIIPNFLFVTTPECSVHSKLKSLLRTPLYTEFSLQESTMEECLSSLKSDATDFIQSFYFEKIKENFNGSYLYFQTAINYLKETGVLIDFENKLIIKGKKSVIMPLDLKGLYKTRMKNFSKNVDISLILAYFSMLDSRLDVKTLLALGVNDVENSLKILSESGVVNIKNNVVSFNDYSLLKSFATTSIKKDALNFLAKNIIAKLGKGLDDTTLAVTLGKLSTYKEEYLTLWKNSQFAINTGDYDAYLKNCLGFLSLVEHIESNISKEEIEENKKEVYNNILMFLYSYSPAKIYFIENILLLDAINSGDDDKIVKLSNLMLQGALISSNYTDALGLLHNILSRLPNPTLLVDGSVNTKFLLLSLVNIEILYNIGDFKQCIEIAEEILSVLTPDILEKIKPASFSTNLFINHLMETFRLVGFAKVFTMDESLEDFFGSIENSLGATLKDKECIIAVKDFLAGKVYSMINIERESAFSKVIYLILQEFSEFKGDYKRFAQNIYQAKLLTVDIQQRELRNFCDLLIGYAYAQAGCPEKADFIYDDIISFAESSALFNILVIAKYLKAKLKFALGALQEGLLLLNDSLAVVKRFKDQAKVFFVLLENLYIETVKANGINAVDLEVEEQKVLIYQDSLKVFFEQE